MFFNIAIPASFAQSTNESLDISTLPDLVDARVSNADNRARIVFDLSDKTLFALVSLDNPMQIAIDIRAANIKFDKNILLAGEGLIKSVVIEQKQPKRIRTLLALSDYAQVQQAYILEPFDQQPARLVVDIVPTSEQQFLANVAKDLAFSQNIAKNNSVDNIALVDNSTAPGELNQQLSSRPLIIIDPGHGGIDGGAQTQSGLKEKSIVLAFANTLQDILNATGSYDVALTRSDDSFISLSDRVNLTRQNKADLFISIHADSFNQPTVGGISIYVRDEEATDVLDKVLAENENKVDIIAGLVPPNIDQHASSALIDLMRREMRRQAYIVANNMIEQLKPSVNLRKFPIRKADFYVLQSPDVPSVLIELGFLSNIKDIENLTAKGWSERVAQSLARGIAVYFNEIEK